MIPVFNMSSFIPITLDSLIKQTLREIEILIIDDGSTDRLFDIVDYYMKKDKRIKYRRFAERKGAARCRNAGNKLALAPIICVTDIGDINMLDRAEIAYNYFRKHPKIGVFCCPVMYQLKRWEPPTVPRVYKARPGERLKFEHPAVAYRKEVVVKYPYREDCIDTDQWHAFFFTLGRNGIKFGVTDKIVISKATLRNYKYGCNISIRKLKKLQIYREFGIKIPVWLLRFEESYKKYHAQ